MTVDHVLPLPPAESPVDAAKGAALPLPLLLALLPPPPRNFELLPMLEALTHKDSLSFTGFALL
jgi:hypothetical protein